MAPLGFEPRISCVQAECAPLLATTPTTWLADVTGIYTCGIRMDLRQNLDGPKFYKLFH
jgi:hypothetical protein